MGLFRKIDLVVPVIVERTTIRVIGVIVGGCVPAWRVWAAWAVVWAIITIAVTIWRWAIRVIIVGVGIWAWAVIGAYISSITSVITTYPTSLCRWSKHKSRGKYWQSKEERNNNLFNIHLTGWYTYRLTMSIITLEAKVQLISNDFGNYWKLFLWEDITGLRKKKQMA